MFGDVFNGKTVWLSGITGFKGAWLTSWLLDLGATVHGYALAPPTNPSLFEQLDLNSLVPWQLADIRDSHAVSDSIQRCQPDFVFHLAAQPLVRLSYSQPVETYQTNVMGTIHVMEALRTLRKPCAAVVVTTDKCYENREWVHSYREEDPLGGHDPYSSSKAACELAVSSWRRSFFADHPVKITTARAGNVIGGGDWATDRILPDCIRALQGSTTIQVRNKTSTRPWQHVLEPLSGYLWLAALLSKPQLGTRTDIAHTSAYNFGPTHEANRTVAELVIEILKYWPGDWQDCSDPQAVHEAHLLQLATDKAHALLGWFPVWKFPDAVRETMTWYRHQSAPSPNVSVADLTRQQIHDYTTMARQLGLRWAV